MSCCLWTAAAPTSNEEAPVPQTALERVKGIHALWMRGSSSGTGMGKHGASLLQISSQLTKPSLLNTMSLGLEGARSRS